jgi:hypothetical protein
VLKHFIVKEKEGRKNEEIHVYYDRWKNEFSREESFIINTRKRI